MRAFKVQGPRPQLHSSGPLHEVFQNLDWPSTRSSANFEVQELHQLNSYVCTAQLVLLSLCAFEEVVGNTVS